VGRHDLARFHCRHLAQLAVESIDSPQFDVFLDSPDPVRLPVAVSQIDCALKLLEPGGDERADVREEPLLGLAVRGQAPDALDLLQGQPLRCRVRVEVLSPPRELSSRARLRPKERRGQVANRGPHCHRPLDQLSRLLESTLGVDRDRECRAERGQSRYCGEGAQDRHSRR
jgi:hypothetical protein